MDRQTVNAHFRFFASKFVCTQSRRINTYRSARKSDLMDTSNPPQAAGMDTRKKESKTSEFLVIG